MRNLFLKLSNLKKRFCKIWANPAYFLTYLKIYKLYKTPRFQVVSTRLLGKDLLIADSASTVFMYKEIFENEIYKFKTKHASPSILDCGANIGMSLIYFKKLFPQAKITAFEPDKKIYDICVKNVKAFGLSDVTVLNLALWKEKTTIQFYSEGADGGRLARSEDTSNLVEVKTCLLSDFLKQPVDLLKIDIEGAEYEVLEESKPYLHNVERIFVEYHSFATKKTKFGRNPCYFS